MNWSPLDFAGKSRFENFGTGLRVTPVGRVVTGGAAVGMIGKSLFDNKFGNPKILNEVPGVQMAEAMSYDFKSNPGMGASGALTLALSKFGMER